MIVFKSIEYKNFLSTGNSPNKIILNSHNSTICTGSTGHGKSSLIDAITFSLFGKPLRNLSRKDKLINSINGKNCEVTIEFSTNGKEYKVIRGIKPDIFEIYANNTLVTQEGNVKDYQTYLESQILHVNYKTFTQVVILGSTNYNPFMKLSAEERRSVIEDILDIKIFSNMNVQLKKKMAETAKLLNDTMVNLNAIKNMAIAQKKVIDSLKKANIDIINTYNLNINNNNQEIGSYQNNISELNNTIILLQNNILNHNDNIKSLNELKSKKMSSSLLLSSLNKEIDFFNKNTLCPTCIQPITEIHKTAIVTKKTQDINENVNIIEEYNKIQKDLETEINNNLQIITDIQLKQNEIQTLNNKIQYLQSQNKKILNDINALSNNNISNEVDKFNEYIVKGKELNEQKIQLTQEQSIQNIASLLLKDTGIKSKIIAEYIPIINKYINEYINELDLYVNFELDEQFRETIKSRHRDKFEYNSFSAGESQKLDLAILFTWRHIAKIKNSCNTNLLIMDEVLDGHLDSNSTTCLLDVFKKYTNVNLFVISHSPENYIDNFDNHIHIEKRNNFSVIV